MNERTLNIKLRELVVEMLRVREAPSDVLTACIESLNSGSVPPPEELDEQLAKMRAGIDPADPAGNLMGGLRGVISGDEFQVLGNSGRFSVTTVLPVMEERIQVRGHVEISRKPDGSRTWGLVHGIDGLTVLSKGIVSSHNKSSDIQLARDLWSVLGV